MRFFVFRYFFALRQKGTVGWLSAISMLGVAVGTAALIIVLSAFNGLERLIEGMYQNFDPELKVLPERGKFFALPAAQMQALQSLPGLQQVVSVVEDNALLRAGNAQMVVRMKGVSDNFLLEDRFQEALLLGRYALHAGPVPAMMCGRGVQQALNLSIGNPAAMAQLWYPKAKASQGLDPSKAFVKKSILPEGVFRLEKQYDEKYVIVPIATAWALTRRPGQVSALELKARAGTSVPDLQEAVQTLLGRQYQVQAYAQQHASLVKVLRLERLFVLLALAVILLIASFNIFTALSMLGVQKRVDISMLKAMGAPAGWVQRMFLWLGLAIAGAGALVGTIVGVGLCLAQQAFGFVSMGMATAIVDAYPIHLQAPDIALALLLVVVTSLAIAYIPARAAETNALFLKDGAE